MMLKAIISCCDTSVWLLCEEHGSTVSKFSSLVRGIRFYGSLNTIVVGIPVGIVEEPDSTKDNTMQFLCYGLAILWGICVKIMLAT